MDEKGQMINKALMKSEKNDVRNTYAKSQLQSYAKGRFIKRNSNWSQLLIKYETQKW